MPDLDRDIAWGANVEANVDGNIKLEGCLAPRHLISTEPRFADRWVIAGMNRYFQGIGTSIARLSNGTSEIKAESTRWKAQTCGKAGRISGVLWRMVKGL